MMQITARAGRVSGWDANLENSVTCQQSPWLEFVPAVSGRATRLGQRNFLSTLGMRGAGSSSPHSLLALLPLSQGRLNTLKG